MRLDIVTFHNQLWDIPIRVLTGLPLFASGNQMPSTLSSDAYAAFIAVMRDARIEAGLTQADIAAKIGQPQSFMSKSERRERRIDVVEFLQIADAIGVSPEALLTRVRVALQQRS